MKCSQCGADLLPGSRFCQRCGLAFPQPVPFPSTTAPKTQSGIVIALLCIFCFPVGLVLVWIHPRWSLRTKQVITAAIVLIGVATALYDISPAGKADEVAREQQIAANALHAEQARVNAAKTKEHDEKLKAAEEARQDDVNAKEAAADTVRAQKSLSAMRKYYLAAPQSKLIDELELGEDPFELRVTVKNTWFMGLYQIRLQSAQNIWKDWAALRSPDDPKRAYITLVDVNGNHIGGSSDVDGAAISVDR